METLRISVLTTLLVPLAVWSACGGSENTPSNSATGTGGATSAGGSSSTGATGTMGAGATAGTMGMTNAGGMAPMLPMETIVYDTTCPDQTFTTPDGGGTGPMGFSLPDGGLTLKGCCTQAGTCGLAVVNSGTFQGMAFNISFCFNPSSIPGRSGGDAGAAKSCTYKAP